MYKYAKYLIRLDHLSQQEKKELQEQYYLNVKPSSLIKKYRIDVSATNLYKCFPPASSKEKCPYCKFPLGYLPTSRNSTVTGGQVCLLCDHFFDNEKCNCSGCKEPKRQIERINELTVRFKNEAISEQINKTKKLSIDINELTPRDRLYLAALVKDCLTNDLKVLNPFAKCPHIRLAPTTKFAQKIYNHLIARGIIHPSDRSHHAFTLENETLEYDLFEIYYDINISNNDITWSTLIKTLLNPLILQSHEIKEGHELWTEIVLHESIEYLRIQLEKCGLIYQSLEIINDKTLLELSTVTEKFSTTQMFKIIWAVANSAAAYKQKYKKNLSVEAITDNLVKYANKAIDGQWEMEGYARAYNNPQTTISSIL
ncbi:hypothetical protein, partial [Sulfuricurvum sp.]|uniref:hypothetical protein n=1 Tax=Sulfuricurvum sp. TaxID=2025608 RepID=UPI002631A6E7